MTTASAFRALEHDAQVRITVDDRPFDVPAGASVAAALLAAGLGSTRTTPVSGAPRAPYCMMGVCFECLVQIDGQPNRQACLVTVADGMQVRTQQGARALRPSAEGAAHVR
jgi:D-hydroxyproline dehydrogenase subunit gamma